MTRLIPAIASFLTGSSPRSDFADLSTRALHGPRPTNRQGAVRIRAELTHLRAAITR